MFFQLLCIVNLNKTDVISYIFFCSYHIVTKYLCRYFLAWNERTMYNYESEILRMVKVEKKWREVWIGFEARYKQDL